MTFSSMDIEQSKRRVMKEWFEGQEEYSCIEEKCVSTKAVQWEISLTDSTTASRSNKKETSLSHSQNVTLTVLHD